MSSLSNVSSAILTGRSDLTYSQGSVPNGSQSQQKSHFQNASQPPPVPRFGDTARQQSHQYSNIQSLFNNEEAAPKLVIDTRYVEQLHQQLVQQTSGCSVEQLEQINTHLMDCLWKMRGEWDRTKVASAIKDTFNEVLEDMLNTQEIASMSQKTKEQLGPRHLGTSGLPMQ